MFLSGWQLTGLTGPTASPNHLAQLMKALVDLMKIAGMDSSAARESSISLAQVRIVLKPWG